MHRFNLLGGENLHIYFANKIKLHCHGWPSHLYVYVCLAMILMIGGGHGSNNQCLVVCVYSDIKDGVKSVVPFNNKQGLDSSNSMRKVCDFEDSIAFFCFISLR